MNKVRLLALNVSDKKGLYEVECDNDKLQTYYDVLGCDCFDIANRYIDGKRFDIFCDDMGLFNDNPIPSALDNDLKPVLVGNLIFANHDYAGNTISLSEEDISHIRSHILHVHNFNNNMEWDVVCPVEY